jgi:hypothetical protein
MPCTVLIILQTAVCVMLLFTECLRIFYGTTSVQLYLVTETMALVVQLGLLVSLYKDVRSYFAGIDTPGNFPKQETVENNSAMLNVL